MRYYPGIMWINYWDGVALHSRLVQRCHIWPARLPVLTAVNTRVILLWDVTPCSFVNICWCFVATFCSLFRVEELWRIILLWNVTPCSFVGICWRFVEIFCSFFRVEELCRIIALWDVTPCSFVDICWCFVGTFCLSLQGRGIEEDYTLVQCDAV